MQINYTVEQLMLDDSFIEYCRNRNSAYKKKWEQIIVEHPSQVKIIEEARRWVMLLNPEISQDEIEEEMNKIRGIINTDKNKTSGALPAEIFVSERLYVNADGKLRHTKLKRVLAYSFILAAMLCSIWYFTNSHIQSAADGKGLTASVNYNNPATTRKQVILPDGSLVILNSNSNLQVSTSFNSTDRIVQLAGEAFFKVRKNPAIPFTVITKTFSTTALGTSFYVHAQNENPVYSVDLLEGKVKLTSTGASETTMYLEAGEQAKWSPVESKFVENNFDTLSLKQWVHGKISFDKTPIKQAISKLEKWYAVDIDLKLSKPGGVSITGDYINAPLDDVLKVICFSLSCKFIYSGNKIIIE